MDARIKKYFSVCKTSDDFKKKLHDIACSTLDRDRHENAAAGMLNDWNVCVDLVCNQALESVDYDPFSFDWDHMPPQVAVKQLREHLDTLRLGIVAELNKFYELTDAMRKKKTDGDGEL